ncbi:HD domain-containing protein [Candidatus Roizmanbacteria bacterium]|nr:HD domain-containing protein [Candidatus Roizmanbacteria bacterium]
MSPELLQLTSQELSIINTIRNIVHEKLSGESTGHDWFHVERVWNMARKIASEEGKPANMFVAEGAALLHDVADWKFHDGDLTVGPTMASSLLQEQNVDPATVDSITRIIEEMSYKGSHVKTPMSTYEGEIVQDADRLDAIGAIGIARVFAYGGKKGKPIYDPNIPPITHHSFEEYRNGGRTSINHFREKLLRLRDLMNTKTGFKIAEGRHQFLELYLARFLQEWEGLL